MGKKRACLIINLRTGEHVANISDLLSVLAAAGWKTDILLKEYAGQTLDLAKEAAQKPYDLIIGYGGDGTLNALLNGVLYTGGKCPVGVIPGGTFNEWAQLVSIPTDPVKAALSLVESDIRKVDPGYLEIEALVPTEQHTGSTSIKNVASRTQRTRQHFLLHVGMGFDAQTIAHISKPVKYRIGRLSFGLAGAKELPQQRPFPITLHIPGMDDQDEISWQGEVWEVILSKVPSFAGTIELDATTRIDDGLLYLCLITANGPIKTLEQALDIMLTRQLGDDTTKYFKGKHISLSIPAWVHVHVDGSVIKLKDLLRKKAYKALLADDQMLVTYGFSVQHKAMSMLVPRDYDGSVFTSPSHSEPAFPEQDKQPLVKTPSPQTTQKPAYTLTVIGTACLSQKHGRYLVAGSYKNERTGETKVATVQVDEHTLIYLQEGERIDRRYIQKVQEGDVMMLVGKKSKRGVIPAQQMTLLQDQAEGTRGP